ncbi:hypothetical protein CFC21_080649 [Triticum aestivum]|uniref:TRF2/HOY1 PH-like domain-containing protein n=2 Tax=Triticum aestivum TaxID=4565 RepID=A0A3B6N2R0_WHEAT|nr:hypothetical protein CFC21_080649 [Triticum aestivum]
MHVVDWTVRGKEQCWYANNENKEEEEMSQFKKLSQSNEGNDVVNELFSWQSIRGRGPLGLKLTKTPALLELIQKKLTLTSKGKGKQTTCDVQTISTAIQGRKPRSQKLHASNFQASSLRIGNWEWKSIYEGDIVAKFYISKNKLAWEILHEGLKSKIEIKCSDICALRITCPKDLPGMLDIMVSAVPQFFIETNPQPRRSTRWLATTDFTGGQASTHSRHVLQCGPGIMDKHIENLLYKNQRLYLLSQSTQNSYRSNYDNLFETGQTWQSLPVQPVPTGKMTLGLNDSGALQGVHFQSSGRRAPLKEDMFNWKNFWGTPLRPGSQPTSMSNSNAGIMYSNSGNHFDNQINSWNLSTGADYSSLREMYDLNGSHTLLPSNSNISSQTMALEQLRENLLSDKEVVNVVDEEDLMSMVNSLSCLIGQSSHS